jgi:hypothetical protein
MDRLPPEMVKIIAAHAGFFDRAKLAVCSNQLSQACAKVTSEVLVVVKMRGAETYAGDGTLWRRCADAPSVLPRGYEGHAALEVRGKVWRIRSAEPVEEKIDGEWRHVTMQRLESFDLRGDSRHAAVVAGGDAGLPVDAGLPRQTVAALSRNRVYYTWPTYT